jgi:hypothetical protein
MRTTYLLFIEIMLKKGYCTIFTVRTIDYFIIIYKEKSRPHVLIYQMIVMSHIQ